MIGIYKCPLMSNASCHVHAPLFSRTEMSSPSHQSCHGSIRVILSLSWPYDNHRLTIFPESHTKKPAIWWYGHYLSSSLYIWCHVIISLVFFYLRYNLERACVRGAKTSKRRFLGVLIMKKLWYLCLPDLCIIDASGQSSYVRWIMIFLNVYVTKS